MTTILPLQCETCKHYRGDSQCSAFGHGRGIPIVIMNMDFDHRSPYPGDGGIRWEPATPDTANPFDEEDELPDHALGEDDH